MIQDHGGPVGAAVTVAGGVASFAAIAIPILQIALLLVSIVVGVLTARWYNRKLHNNDNT